MKRILILGATSAIAEQTARLWAAQGARFYLAARNGERLKEIARDLKGRGAEAIATACVDFCDESKHAGLVTGAHKYLAGIDIVLLAHGVLPDQKTCELDYRETEEAIRTNYLSAVSLLMLLAKVMEEQRSGTLAVITSVAGDRGRAENYVYGSAKAGLNVFLQGLRNRLFASDVHVLTIKPGFVSTPMSARFKKTFLFARPETVARGIVRAVDLKRDEVYLPWFWWPIMKLYRAIPEGLFKRRTSRI